MVDHRVWKLEKCLFKFGPNNDRWGIHADGPMPDAGEKIDVISVERVCEIFESIIDGAACSADPLGTFKEGFQWEIDHLNGISQEELDAMAAYSSESARDEPTVRFNGDPIDRLRNER